MSLGFKRTREEASVCPAAKAFCSPEPSPKNTTNTSTHIPPFEAGRLSPELQKNKLAKLCEIPGTHAQLLVGGYGALWKLSLYLYKWSETLQERIWQK